MNSSEDLFEARHLRRRAGSGEILLQDVSLRLSPGDSLAIVGPTGSGKTLLLRSLALLDPLEQGKILLRGRTPESWTIPQFRSQVIYLHQQPAPAEGSVEKNLKLVYELKIYQDKKYDRDFLLDQLRLLGREENFLEKQQRDLSGGESQIVALLRALQLAPTVLLLDESTAALDPSTTQAVEQLIEHWVFQQPQQRAVVWVSHDSRQTDRVANRTLQMMPGGSLQGS